MLAPLVVWWSPHMLFKSSTNFKHLPFDLPKATDRKEEHFRTLKMNSIQECAPPAAKLLVGVSHDAETSIELISWAVGVAANPNDTIIALHVLAKGKEERRPSTCKSRLRQAKAFVISIAAEFAEICQTKQVKLEAKVRTSYSIGRGLTEEAALLGANFILLQRNSFAIVKYCLKHAPEGCSVIGLGKQGLLSKDSDFDLTINDDDHSLSSKSSNGSIHLTKALRKVFTSNSKREKGQAPIETINENGSPTAVLDGPEERNTVLEDCSSPSSKGTSSRRSYSNMWRRLSIMKLLSPLFHSSEDVLGKDSDAFSSYTEDQRPSWTCFSYDEISCATNNFHPDNLVGRGGFAEVFSGELYSGKKVAVKRLAKGKANEQKDKEFLIELGILGHVCHPNTVHLIGCCIENGLHLIFDFSLNGSLAMALHGANGSSLEWSARYKIAIGIARGLHYLHKCCRHRIIHRDIKASNVLLGPDFEPQISDFGLAKWLPKQWTHHSVIPIEGTFGYLAPEYFMHGIVDEKTDVFAFGVLLLEIVSGRRPVDSTKQSLLVWAKPFLESGRIAELADSKLGGKYDMDQLKSLVKTASYCVKQSSIWRPSMTEVLQLLINDDDSVEAESWRTPECEGDEMDDHALAAESYLTC